MPTTWRPTASMPRRSSPRATRRCPPSRKRAGGHSTAGWISSPAARQNSAYPNLLGVFAARSAWADHLPAAEDALFPEAAGSDRRAPSLGEGRLIHIPADPDAALVSAQPLGLSLWPDEQDHGRQDRTCQSRQYRSDHA